MDNSKEYSGQDLDLNKLLFRYLSFWPYILITVFISVYHYGIEKNIFEEFSGCTSNSLEIVDKTELLNSLNENVASCKDAIFKLFGMSLAGINFILSLLIIVYSFLTLFYEKN